MMRRWKQLYGKEATYLKLTEGLRQVGRTDLIELVLSWLIEIPDPAARAATLWYNLPFHMPFKWEVVFLLIVLILMPTIAILSTRNLWILLDIGFDMNNTFHANTSTEHDENYQNPSIWNQSGVFNHSTVNCSDSGQPSADLPILYHDLFVGRENDVEEVVRRVASAHILSTSMVHQDLESQH